MCARPKFGKWLGCVAMDTADDWLVCIVQLQTANKLKTNINLP